VPRRDTTIICLTETESVGVDPANRARSRRYVATSPWFRLAQMKQYALISEGPAEELESISLRAHAGID